MYQNPLPNFRANMLTCMGLALIFLACQSKPGADKNNSSLEVEQKEVKLVSEVCDENANRCATFEVDYPILKGNFPAIGKINDSIEYYVAYGMDLNSEGRVKGSSIQDIAKAFVSEYETYVKDQTAEGNAEFITTWFMECDALVSYESPKAVSMTFNKYTFAGGAHPNTYTLMRNYDLKTGKVIELKDIVTDMKKLKTLVEKEFRSVRDLSPTENLSDAGYFWDGSFELSENFSLDSRGLQFIYNAYEVAAYAAGPTEVFMPWSELEGIIRKELIE
jgi:hypothetical protein